MYSNNIYIYIYKEFTLVQVAIGQSIYFTAQGLYVLWMLNCKINLECLITGKDASNFTRKKYKDPATQCKDGGGGDWTKHLQISVQVFYKWLSFFEHATDTVHTNSRQTIYMCTRDKNKRVT